MVAQVDKLALTTGSSLMPAHKGRMGFERVPDKFAQAGLTAVPSELVAPPRVLECPVQLEAVVKDIRDFEASYAAAIEVRIVRAYFEDSILNDQKRHGVDTEKWKPLIMSFCEFYGLGENLHPSRLAKVFEVFNRVFVRNAAQQFRSQRRPILPKQDFVSRQVL